MVSPNNSQQQIAATILLCYRDPKVADDLLAGTAPALVHGESSDAISANPESVQKVAEFADEHGLQVTEANATTRTIKVQGTAEQMSAAFGVSLGLVSGPDGSKHVSHREAISIPESLSNLVAAVLGLDQRPVAKHHDAMAKTV